MYQLIAAFLAILAMVIWLIVLKIKYLFAKEAYRKELRKKYLVSRYQVEIEQRKKCAKCVVGGIKLCKI